MVWISAWRSRRASRRRGLITGSCRSADPLRFLCRDNEEGRAVALIGEARLGLDLRIVRAPFLDVRYREPGPDEQIDRGRDCAVLLDDARSQPIGRAGTLVEVMVDRPDLMAGGVEQPFWLGGCGVNRVLHREHQA